MFVVGGKQCQDENGGSCCCVRLVFSAAPSVALDAVGVAAIRRGQSVAAPSSAPGRYRLIDPEGRLLAWAEVDAAHRLQPRAVFSS